MSNFDLRKVYISRTPSSAGTVTVLGDPAEGTRKARGIVKYGVVTKWRKYENFSKMNGGKIIEEKIGDPPTRFYHSTDNSAKNQNPFRAGESRKITRHAYQKMTIPWGLQTSIADNAKRPRRYFGRLSVWEGHQTARHVESYGKRNEIKAQLPCMRGVIDFGNLLNKMKEIK